MLRLFVPRAARSTIALALLTSACNLVDGLNGLQKVSCIGACESAAADGGFDAAPELDAAKAPDDAAGDIGASGDAGDAGPTFDAAANDASDASPGPGLDAGDASDSGGPSLYLGCFADSTTRDLPVTAYSDPQNTPALCIATCADGGYAYAGVQNQDECRCGSAYGGQGPSNGCIEPCSGDSTVVCGGSYANSVYATTQSAILPPPKLLGCFGDGTARDLPYSPYTSDLNTIESCVVACTYAGYRFAGTQYGTQCYCGSSYGVYGTSLGCIDPCSGDPSETCGGTSANDVYRTSVTDAGTDAG